MDLSDKTINERVVYCVLDDSDLFSILSQYVAKQSDFTIDPRKTKIEVIIEKVSTSIGFENKARVTLKNELGK